MNPRLLLEAAKTCRTRPTGAESVFRGPARTVLEVEEAGAGPRRAGRRLRGSSLFGLLSAVRSRRRHGMPRRPALARRRPSRGPGAGAVPPPRPTGGSASSHRSGHPVPIWAASERPMRVRGRVRVAVYLWPTA